MDVHFERSGGFAGITQRCSVSVESLSEEERRTLTDLIARSHFFDLPGEIKSETGADQFQYKISISSDQATHEVRVGQQAAPAELQPLIAWLQATARKR